ncbi:MAG TPA: nucleotide disphospho-sugar-binding domain-containing protein [Conexibacter sp.]|jgi:UDP:flavonoid glycosyltransferase YjiC (YdhE family)
MRALMVTWDGGGNLPPALGIARELQRRGDRVRVLGHEIQRAEIDAAGLEFHPFVRGRDYVSAEPRGTVGGVLGLVGLFADRGISEDALELLRPEPADILIVDCLLWGATGELVASSGIPVVSLVHSRADFFDRNARGPLGMLARLRGADPLASRNAAMRLITTRADFEPPRDDPAANPHTGFVWQGEPVEATPSEHPDVLVSFSTTTFPGQATALQRVIDALADEDVQVTVTSGAVDPATLRPAANTRIVRRQDHAELLPHSSLVIGHGGHATTARALGHGIPVLVMPMHPLMDQPAIGRAVEALGVGMSLPKSASAPRIREAARRLLTDRQVQAAARRIGVETRSRDGAATAADVIAAAAAHPTSDSRGVDAG